jgi:hypothetical protein
MTGTKDQVLRKDSEVREATSENIAETVAETDTAPIAISDKNLCTT